MAGRVACLALPLIAWGAAIGVAARSPHPAAADTQAVPASSPATSVPAAVCARCHADVHDRWTGARHAKMLQPAAPGSVRGDFSGASVSLRGRAFLLTRQGDQYFVRGPFPGATEELHRVDFTLGSRRVQHYLTRLRDGRIVVLPPSWDVERRQWFHNLDIVNPDEAAENPVQVWNSSCLDCHVSGAAKRFDPATATYDTRWTDFGTSCERCHGPGAAHVARYDAGAPAAGPGRSIVRPTRLDAERSSMVCAQCHSLRDVTIAGFQAGGEYFDHFTPVLEYAQGVGADPAYWPDGRPRRFSNDAIGLWQSRCFLDGGATCTTCHVDPHEPDIDRNPTLSRASDSACAACHASTVAAGVRHTRHAPGSAGAACVACHMPRTVVSLRSRMPDHAIGVPAPENTVRHGIPNACSECHREKPPDWAVGVLAEWYPQGRRTALIRRADAFSAARRREASAIDLLIRIANDNREPPLVRANAVGYLRAWDGPKVETYLSAFASSEHAAVRLSAVLGLGSGRYPAQTVTPVLMNALGDSRRVVRVGAALGLVNLKTIALDGPAGALFEQAKREYVARGAVLADDPAVLLDIGKFHLMNREASAAAGVLSASLRLNPGLHASRYFLALALVAQGRTPDAREHLRKIPKDDAHAAMASALLATLNGGRDEP